MMLRITKLSTTLLLMVSTQGTYSATYVGVGLGPYFANFEQKSNVVQPILFNVSNKTQFSGLGVFGSVFGGLSYVQEKRYIAVELNVDFNSATAKTSNREFINQNFSASDYEMSENYGLSVLPGYFFSDCTLIYVRLSYSNAYFDLSTSDSSLVDTDKRLSGYRLGLGLKNKIAKNVSVRIEYSQAGYQGISFKTIDLLSSVTKTTKINPFSGQVEFGVVYDFS